MKTIIPILVVILALCGCGAGRTETASDTPTDYAGVFLDDEGTYCDLTITPDSTQGYHISISIFRLATFDDGRGRPTAEGLPFTATDPAGQPIKGIVTLHADTAIVTFTDSRWDLLETGTQFRYFRRTRADSIRMSSVGS